MNKLAEKLRELADTSKDKDAVLLHFAANQMDFMDAQNERLNDKLKKIAEQEEYK
jgi:hypothetical protein